MIGFPGEGFADEKSIVDSWLTSYLGHDVPLPPKILVAKTQEVINHKAFVAVPVMIMVNKQKYNLQIKIIDIKRTPDSIKVDIIVVVAEEEKR